MRTASGKGQFVFVSHAKADKPTLRFIIDALIDANIKFWIDDTTPFGFTREQAEQHCYHLSAGAQWRNQIEEAVEESTCVLVCWSKTAAEPHRYVILEEAALGRRDRKLVSCQIDDVSPMSLKNDFGLEQVTNLYAAPDGVPFTPAQQAERAKALVSDVRRKMEVIYGERVKTRAPRDEFAPYLVNRRKQEEVAAQIIRTASNGGVRALFMQGPRNECPDQFRERLRRYTSADCLANGLSWQEVIVDWPTVEEQGMFGQVYEANLARALRIRLDEVRRHLLQPRGAPIAAISGVGMTEWGKQQKHLLLAWLKWWKSVAGPAGEAKVIPILTVDLPAAKPGWKKLPPVRDQGVSAERIWKDAMWAQKAAAGLSREHAPLSLLETLHPIERHDAHLWLGKVEPEGGSERYATVDKAIDKAFDAKDARKGMSMKDFADSMRTVLNPAKT